MSYIEYNIPIQVGLQLCLTFFWKVNFLFLFNKQNSFIEDTLNIYINIYIQIRTVIIGLFLNDYCHHH